MNCDEETYKTSDRFYQWLIDLLKKLHEVLNDSKDKTNLQILQNIIITFVGTRMILFVVVILVLYNPETKMYFSQPVILLCAICCDPKQIHIYI